MRLRVKERKRFDMPRVCVSLCIHCKTVSWSKHSGALLDAFSVIWQATCCRLPSSDHMKYSLQWIQTFPQYGQLVSHGCCAIIPCQLHLSSTNSHIVARTRTRWLWQAEVTNGQMFRIKFSNQFLIWLSEMTKYLYNCPCEEKRSYMVWKCSTDWNIS